MLFIWHYKTDPDIELERSSLCDPTSKNSVLQSSCPDLLNSSDDGPNQDQSCNSTEGANSLTNELGTLSQQKEKDILNRNLSHNSRSSVNSSINDDEIPDMELLSLLTHDQLLLKLKQAYDRIRELESAQGQISFYPDDSTIFDSVDNSSLEETNLENDILFITTKLRGNIENGEQSNLSISNPTIRARNGDRDGIFVAYEHKGPFPLCDEDLSISPEYIHPGDSDSGTNHDIVFEGGVWEDYSDDDDDERAMKVEEEANDSSEFPLIPSPVLNTPPYEYIFLTRENEAKFRIFLNPKLNKVFQEEVSKLQKLEENNWNSDDEDSLYYKNAENVPSPNQVDLNNQNHLVNCSSTLIQVKSAASVSNIIHCFDPSDVDLELRKIFTEKPPITHKIVRRKPRRDRGSSVPAVDSYYGTSDLNKVGHASYFIPALTETERKAIGWKEEYHFGHWKYTAMNVPDIRINPICLHPHPHLDDESKSTTHSKHSHHHHHHHHHHHQDPFLSQNPIHQREIDFSSPFIVESDSKENVEQSKPHTSCTNPIHHRNSKETLSFLTLSGDSANPSSHSCHLIPDKCALMKILKCLLPSCAKPGVSATPSLSLNPSLVNSAGDGKKEKKEKKEKKAAHEIQTIVEAPDKLTFPDSHTHITFATMKVERGRDKKKLRLKMSSGRSSREKSKSKDEHSPTAESAHHDKCHQHQRHSHHHHPTMKPRPEAEPTHRSHHHGIFHWRHILNHRSNGSTSVVGGDVLMSNHDSKNLSTSEAANVTVIGVEKEEVERSNLKSGDGPSSVSAFQYESFTDSSGSENNLDELMENKSSNRVKPVRVKRKKKLKSCRAHNKLLTLKDLGYQTDSGDDIDSPGIVTGTEVF